MALSDEELPNPTAGSKLVEEVNTVFPEEADFRQKPAERFGEIEKNEKGGNVAHLRAIYESDVVEPPFTARWSVSCNANSPESPVLLQQKNNNARKKPPPSAITYTETFDESMNADETDYGEKIDRQNAQTLGATKNMVMLMEEGREAGYRTQANLQNQGEKLRGVERDMDRMDSAFDEAEAHLDEMEGNAGCCGAKKKQKKNRAGGKSANKKIKYKGVGNGDDIEEAKNRDGNFKYVTGDARERQMADNLDMVDDILDEMDYMADDLNREITGQNKVIGRIQEKGTKNQEQLRRINEKADRVAKGGGKQQDNGGGNGGMVGAAMGM